MKKVLGFSKARVASLDVLEIIPGDATLVVLTVLCNLGCLTDTCTLSTARVISLVSISAS